MLLDTPVASIMSRELISVDPEDFVKEVTDTFSNHAIRHAPVVEEGELVGMLSWIDIQKIPVPIVYDSTNQDVDKDFRKLIVRDLMTPDPVSIQVDDSLRDLAVILTENEFHAVPVLDGERVVGIVSTTDLIRFFLDQE